MLGSKEAQVNGFRLQGVAFRLANGARERNTLMWSSAETRLVLVKQCMMSWPRAVYKDERLGRPRQTDVPFHNVGVLVSEVARASGITHSLCSLRPSYNFDCQGLS